MCARALPNEKELKNGCGISAGYGANELCPVTNYDPSPLPVMNRSVTREPGRKGVRIKKRENVYKKGKRYKYLLLCYIYCLPLIIMNDSPETLPCTGSEKDFELVKFIAYNFAALLKHRKKEHVAEKSSSSNLGKHLRVSYYSHC